jgi:hypothetical protein
MEPHVRRTERAERLIWRIEAKGFVIFGKSPG